MISRTRLATGAPLRHAGSGLGRRMPWRRELPVRREGAGREAMIPLPGSYVGSAPLGQALGFLQVALLPSSYPAQIARQREADQARYAAVLPLRLALHGALQRHR